MTYILYIQIICIRIKYAFIKLSDLNYFQLIFDFRISYLLLDLIQLNKTMNELFNMLFHSLYNECDQCATAGLVHLTVGRVHLELAGFCKALEAFQRAHKIAHSIQDPSLELQVRF